MKPRLGLIAGSGRLPLLALDAARSRGYEVLVAAIREETVPEIEERGASSVHWMSLGDFSKVIGKFQREGVQEAVMVGQVNDKHILCSIRPDWKLAKLLPTPPVRHTDSQIGGVAKFLAREGITLLKMTALLGPLLARAGVLTRRSPTAQEQTNITYGSAVAQHIARIDVGQTVVIADAACVAVEAMDGTDATILRAGTLMRSLCGESALLSRSLTVVKVAKINQDMRFDVPVIGLQTIETMRNAGATCLALDAGRCLVLDGEAVIKAADEAEITIVVNEVVRRC
ncbi:MAG TPA: UDP-2,3-diacylglucosamine diphosphatase LpxI [Candidatus Nanoarchaeia archaeon]|nr:UDP-2,3-diacylglucosamine diphosphatase LpxI [Candidatus Nanoarchaeia archaeon]